MSSAFTPLKIELITTGEQSGTWGDTTNINLGTAIEEAIVGNALVTFAGSDVTLTLANVNTTQPARNLRLELTGTSAGARNLYVPAIEKPYIIANGLADAVTVLNSTGVGVVVPAGKSMWVYNNGSDVVNVVSHLTALSLGTALPVASGGTGSTSPAYCSLTTNVTGTLPVANGGTGSTATTYCSLTANVTGTLPVANGGTGVTTSTGTGNVVLSASPTLTGSPVAPTQAAGDNSTKIATTAYVATAVSGVAGSLGTMAIQNANAVAITGGTVAGITGSINSVTPGSNATGSRTVSTGGPSGGSNGDIWYKV